MRVQPAPVLEGEDGDDIMSIDIQTLIVINLVFQGIIRVRARLVLPMRLAFGSWLVTLIMGLHIYLVLWV